ncbi:DUF5801 repeats-in-toxin domain-containing protein, partial [Mesorhizobium sp. GbtcB19]|uniref:DUF5801 repeats-in-toxin domain-containing protein n=1 Tax=Mesorhizobium sp. GbtcB19 TaxID=2824764 RepID=UPI0020C71006
MTTTIDINGTLTLDQTSGLQDDDTAISNDLTGLSTPFKTFLNGLTGSLQLTAGQLSFADDVEAAVSGAGFVTVNAGGATISKLFFSDGSGAAFDGDQVIYNGNPLQTVDGHNIYFHSYENGTIVLATTSATEGAGEVVAAFYLNAAGDNLSASIEMVTFEPIAHPDTTNPDDSIDWTNLLNVSASGSTSFNFDGLASGNNLFVAVGSTSAGLVVSGIHPVIHADGTLDNSGDNIKTSQGGIGATIGVNNQMFDPGETAVFSFVKGQAPGTYGDLDNMSYNDFIDVKDATLFISQTEGSPGTNFTVKIGAFSAGGASTDAESGRSYLDNNLGSGANLGNDAGQSALTDDTAVAIVRVVIKDGNGVVVTDTTGTNSFVTFNADGTITAQHLNDAYTVQWFTDNTNTQAVETFNRFQATAVVGKFDVGRVDLSQGVTVTESVGDKLHTDDDGPSITTTGTEPTLTVDETVLGTNDTKSFAANFSPVYGTDGAGTVTYALSFNAGATGLVDTATNQAVVLSLTAGGVIEGRTAISGDLVFTVSVDASGNVTLDQIRAVVHPTSDPDESKTLAADNLIQLTATATDKDGDHQSATLDIGQNLNFKDDGPSITTTGTEPTLTVDETVLGTNDTKSFAANFSPVYGTDGAGTVTYALSFNAGSTGLVDTATNQAVVLSLTAGGVVEGRTAVSGDLVFTVSVDASGNVTLDQIRAVVHPTSDPDESKTLAADNLVQLTATVTDKDGDHQSATLDIGQNLNFKDDGPSITTTGTEPTLTVDETVLGTNDTKSFAANFSPVYGTDGAGTVTYALSFNAGSTGLVDTATNQAVVLSLTAGGVVEGRTAVSGDLVFTVSVDASGNVTLDQFRAVVHPTSDPDETKTLAADNLVQLTATVTDKDGDHQSATLDIGQNLNFKDDGPSITTTGTEPTLTVDETVLGTDDTKSFAANFSPIYGTDGAGTVTYALSFNAGATGLVDTATNQAVVLSLTAGGVVEGRTAISGDLVFTVSVDGSGNVTLDQIRAVVHPTSDPDESKTLAADNLIQLTATVTDKDGDHQSATLDIGQNLNFKDDGPSITTTGTEPTLTVDETVLGTDDTKSFAANFSPVYGADGAGTVTYALSFNAGATGLVDTATNQAVVLSLTAGGVVEGRTAVSGDLVFTVSVDASGNVTLDQIRAVVHPTSDPDESKTLAADNLVQLTATVTDKDGDHQSATLDIGQNLNFKDDGPSITTTGTEPTLTVDETVLGTNDTKSFAANFSPVYGADGAGTVTYALSFNAGATGLVDTATNQAVVLSLTAGGVVEGRTAVSGDLVFTVSVDASGNVTLDQIRAVVHPTSDPDESKTLAADNLVQLTATVTDKDG